MSKTAVVILNWNGAQYLSQFLPSVCQHTPENADIIVADNGSTDASQEAVSTFPRVKWLALGENYGFAEGYNRALREIAADYYVLLNSDVEVTANWLEPLTDFLDNHAEVAACQPKIKSFHQKNFFEHAGAAGGMIDMLGYPYCRGRMFDKIEEDHGQYDQAARIFWASGACLCIRSYLYHETGGLDKDFFAHMEEIDLCWRLGCRGWSVFYVPESTVFHIGGGSLPKENPRKDYLNFRNNLLMLYKNLPAKQLQRVMIARYWMDLAAALQALLSGKKATAKAIMQARKDYRNMKQTPDFVIKRQTNLQCMRVARPFGIMRRSIVWDHYIRKMNH